MQRKECRYREGNGAVLSDMGVVTENCLLHGVHKAGYFEAGQTGSKRCKGMPKESGMKETMLALSGSPGGGCEVVVGGSLVWVLCLSKHDLSAQVALFHV